ncbi:hypothetical protein IWX90DRAFT_35315 [Phyllosticta citrichinensis]|uniref:Uncharacterized protein n=1 Tax=Phyllosticta citrichinensis TaxID=1130410 RepID=A0ABR1Y7L5_9PEZI
MVLHLDLVVSQRSSHFRRVPQSIRWKRYHPRPPHALQQPASQPASHHHHLHCYHVSALIPGLRLWRVGTCVKKCHHVRTYACVVLPFLSLVSLSVTSLSFVRSGQSGTRFPYHYHHHTTADIRHHHVLHPFSFFWSCLSHCSRLRPWSLCVGDDGGASEMD